MFQYLYTLWRNKGWLLILVAAIVILGFCRIFSDKKFNVRIIFMNWCVKIKKPNHIFLNLIKGFSKHFDAAVNYINAPHSRDPHRQILVYQQKVKEKLYVDKHFKIYLMPFPKCVLIFYLIQFGENLEYDMYNKDYRLAVEYNGQQH